MHNLGFDCENSIPIAAAIEGAWSVITILDAFHSLMTRKPKKSQTRRFYFFHSE